MEFTTFLKNETSLPFSFRPPSSAREGSTRAGSEKWCTSESNFYFKSWFCHLLFGFDKLSCSLANIYWALTRWQALFCLLRIQEWTRKTYSLLFKAYILVCSFIKMNNILHILLLYELNRRAHAEYLWIADAQYLKVLFPPSLSQSLLDAGESTGLDVRTLAF